MHEDFDVCYRAMRGRDRRFDGRFVVAVRTTGIYCRPSCPAQTPKEENVRFYPRPAAAAAAGYRACKRCRPDVAPGTRHWDIRGDLAARALRAIESGAIDTDGVPGLARRLAVSERHLHRVLVTEVGAGPLALARTRRAQAARTLVEHTTLPLTDVAFTSGFSSIRQFNEVMRAEFGCPPSALRRPTASDRVDGVGTLTLRLQHRAPYAAAETLAWFAARSVAGVETLADTTYTRSVGTAVVELRPDPEHGHVLATLHVDDLRTVADVVARCRRLLDLDADPTAVADVLGADPLLRRGVRRRPGLRVPGTVDGFELAVRAVLGQRVSVAAARVFAGRLVALLGAPLPTPVGGVTHAFPTAAAVADADLDGIGVTKARAATLRALAREVAADRLVLDPAADRDEVRAALLAVPGIGPWTADYVSMRALGDPDAFPAGDLVLRRMLAARPDADSRRWRPWRAYAAMHLWQMSSEENR